MKYSLVTLTALVAAAHAQAGDSPKFLNSAYDVQRGKPFELRYSGCNSGCTITLKNGPSNNLKAVKVLSDSATGNSISVTLDDSLPTGQLTFAIEDNQSREVNYSPQFSYQGGASSTSKDNTSAASSTTSAPTDSATSMTTASTDSTSTTGMSSDSMMTPSSTSTSAETTSSASSMTSMIRNTTSTTSASSTGQTTSSTNIPTAGVGRITATWALALSAVAMVSLLN